MPDIVREAFIISDLHLGGAPPDEASADPGDRRGFRMMTHAADLAEFIRIVAARPSGVPVELVINGDFIDFLAEKHPGDEPWLPFLYEPGAALATFQTVVDREPARRGRAATARRRGASRRGNR
jgi:hypothetical protein